MFYYSYIDTLYAYINVMLYKLIVETVIMH